MYREVIRAMGKMTLVLNSQANIESIYETDKINDKEIKRKICKDPLKYITDNLTEVPKKLKETKERIYELFNWEGTLEVCGDNNALKVLSITLRPLQSSSGAIIIVEDVTETRRALQELKHKEIALEDTINSILLVDSGGRVYYINDSFKKLWGVENLSQVEGISLENTVKDPKAIRMIQGAVRDEGNWRGEICVTPKGAKEKTLLTTITKVGCSSLDDISYIVLAMDISDRKQREDKLEHLALRDNLTGLFNRALFDQKIKELDVPSKLPLTLLMGDVNCLKLINDVFGHSTGDLLLKKVSSILKSNTRASDIVCRWGGDEYVILLPNTSKDVVSKLIERIKNQCNEETFSDSIRGGPSISLGFATKEKEDEDIMDTLSRAEEYMYNHKSVEGPQARLNLVFSLLRDLSDRSYETKEHSERIADILRKFGKVLGKTPSELDHLDHLAKYHDIGKVTLSEGIISSKESLTREQINIMRTHPHKGFTLLKSYPETAQYAEDVLHHHERWDGKGYPDKLKGEDIPFNSRMLAIVDAYEVMTRGRPYRDKLTHEQAIKEIQKCSGTQFDPSLVEVFVGIDLTNKKI